MILLALACRTTLVADADPTGAVERWDEALRDAVDDQGMVDYDVLEQRRGDLEAYVAWIGRDEATVVPRSMKRKTDGVRNLRHAFWINAYNALTLFQVLERGRPASILDVDGWAPLPGSGFFLETEFKTGKIYQSLSDIEHERLRMRELDYRDHAAINCASTSCPPLRSGLYKARGLDAQLDEQMDRWVADPERGMRFEGDALVVSPIFEWFSTDFRFTSGGMDLCGVLAAHTPSPQRERLLSMSEQGCPHTTFAYDWSLNHRAEALP